MGGALVLVGGPSCSHVTECISISLISCNTATTSEKRTLLDSGQHADKSLDPNLLFRNKFGSKNGQLGTTPLKLHHIHAGSDDGRVYCTTRVLDAGP